MPNKIRTLSCEDAIAFICDSQWGFAEVDAAGKFVWVNRSYAENILNAPVDLVIGTHFREWTHADDVEIDIELSDKVKSGEIPGYTLSKRYIQRGSTPANQKIIWGMLSVQGKFSKTGEFVAYLVQFRPYNNVQALRFKIDAKEILTWATENWKTIVTVIAVSTSLIFGGSERLFDMLKKAKEVEKSVDSALQPSSSGQSHLQP